MRANTIRKLVALVGDEVVDVESGGDDPQAIARRLMVDRFGARCSGWIVFEHRKQLRATGAIDFRILRRQRAKLPMWFALAMSFLERKSASFEVERRDDMRALVWRVKWKNRGYWRELIERVRAPS